MPAPLPRKVHEETLMCGYKKCCPVLKIFEDGSAELSDDDQEIGSVGTIKLRSEAVSLLVERLSTHKK